MAKRMRAPGAAGRSGSIWLVDSRASMFTAPAAPSGNSDDVEVISGACGRTPGKRQREAVRQACVT
ncbi:MAG TPA: hypothetical protein VM532_05330 [Burkholderiales bacterium]|nr:hypothetical protein [Burkholderiales bacterium]